MGGGRRRPPATGAAPPTAVFKGTEHLYEAAKFALWLNTSDEALTPLNETAAIYPATKAGLELPALAEGVEFYGGQKIYDVFAEAAGQVNPDFTWGPTMTQTYADVSDGFKAAVSGSGTLADALAAGQAEHDRGPRGAVDPRRRVARQTRMPRASAFSLMSAASARLGARHARTAVLVRPCGAPGPRRLRRR